MEHQEEIPIPEEPAASSSQVCQNAAEVGRMLVDFVPEPAHRCGAWKEPIREEEVEEKPAPPPPPPPTTEQKLLAILREFITETNSPG